MKNKGDINKYIEFKWYVMLRLQTLKSIGDVLFLENSKVMNVGIDQQALNLTLRGSNPQLVLIFIIFV